MNDYNLMVAYKAMLYTAKMHGFEVDEKHDNLHKRILENVELDVSDMVDNLDAFYNALNELPVLQEDE